MKNAKVKCKISNGNRPCAVSFEGEENLQVFVILSFLSEKNVTFEITYL